MDHRENPLPECLQADQEPPPFIGQRMEMSPEVNAEGALENEVSNP